MKLTRSKLIVALVIVALAVVATLFVVNQRRDGASHASQSDQLYTCGMHPQVIQNKPGNCPICGMKLTPVRKQPDAKAGSTNATASGTNGERRIKYYKSTMLLGEISQSLRKDSMGMDMVPVYEDEAADTSTISIDPVTTQNMGLRTGVVTKGPLRRSIRTVGVVDFDETTLADVTTKFKGWIEKLYVDSTGKQAHKGEPLFEIYSPELLSAQTEYLLALNQTTGTPGTESLRATALTKLKFFDISDEQTAELEKTRAVKKTLRVTTPRDGIVVEKMAVEGQMVDAGMKLYRLADLGIVWVQAQVFEQDLVFVRLGQEATVSLSYLPDRKFRGRVTYVYPTVDEKTRTARVRMEFHNPGYFLKPGMFATVELQAELAESAILVPDMAVLRSGEKNTVFVALPEGKFEPRTVTLGPRSENNLYQVLSGLSEGERVVTSGQFMLDSESQLREAIQKMLQPGDATATNEHAGHIATPTDATTAAASSDIAYICPMPEHVALKYSKPGPCPLCGMALVPVSAELLAKIQPGGRVEHYTCPMPEHSDVKLDKPGKCPRCGMTLIPMMQTPPPVTVKPSAPEGHQH
ncbi:MAG: efflux RND transporter periplasmic adaptor subunit [Verrucomicrobia bacterium]|nr:efflux RND transporter periplasmic adaptor subunit [Verrucomicrobiota bacterium]